LLFLSLIPGQPKTWSREFALRELNSYYYFHPSPPPPAPSIRPVPLPVTFLFAWACWPHCACFWHDAINRRSVPDAVAYLLGNHHARFHTGIPGKVLCFFAIAATSPSFSCKHSERALPTNSANASIVRSTTSNVSRVAAQRFWAVFPVFPSFPVQADPPSAPGRFSFIMQFALCVCALLFLHYAAMFLKGRRSVVRSSRNAIVMRARSK